MVAILSIPTLPNNLSFHFRGKAMKTIFSNENDHANVHIKMEDSSNEYLVSIAYCYTYSLHEHSIDFAFKEFERIFGLKLLNILVESGTIFTTTFENTQNNIQSINGSKSVFVSEKKIPITEEDEEKWFSFVRDNLPSGHYKLINS